MKYNADGSISELPVCRPASAQVEFQDTLLRATQLSASDVKLLDKILAHYGDSQ